MMQLFHYSVFAADLDGDDYPDLAVTNWPYGVSILLNNGDRTFQSAVNYDAGSYPISVFSIDLDGDSDNDLAVANRGSNNISILMNNGDGTFQTAVHYDAGDEPCLYFPNDLNGDGDLDLAVANKGVYPYDSNGRISILLNNGDGTFQPAVDYDRGALQYLFLC